MEDGRLTNLFALEKSIFSRLLMGDARLLNPLSPLLITAVRKPTDYGILSL